VHCTKEVEESKCLGSLLWHRDALARDEKPTQLQLPCPAELLGRWGRASSGCLLPGGSRTADTHSRYVHTERDILADDIVLEAAAQPIVLLHKPRTRGAEKLASVVNMSGNVKEITVLQF